MTDDRDVSVTLMLDGIYFREANRAAQAAKPVDLEFSKWQKYIRETNEKIDAIFSDLSKDDDEAEGLCIELDRHWQSFDSATARLVQSVAATHILCASCLEAHINMRAEEMLNKKDFAEFDKLSVAGKWLFYPNLMSVGRFDPGRKPFQDLEILLRRRNALVHYKKKNEKTKHPYDMPNLIENLGLRETACTESLSAVSLLVKSLAQMEGRDKPGWLETQWCSAFALSW